MKIRLIVAGGPGAGKVIPVAVSPFLIGRNPVCQLRPASAMVSNRHCTIWQRSGTVSVQDMSSTNGTFVNGVRITAERTLQNGDRLQVGPLVFDVQLETSLPVNEPTPAPPISKPDKASDPEDAAALILFDDDARPPDAASPPVDATGVPTGSTTMLPSAPLEDSPAENEKKAAAEKKAKEDTASAADAILKRYMRRPRK
jgi:pSer/pThr/pTyr-binding forkhead associated (FHA) protein